MSGKVSQYYTQRRPLIDSGTTTGITVSQKAGPDGWLNLTTPSQVKIRVDGPQTGLTEKDIGGVFPAPNSNESPDEFLPHIALTRRTLPWERNGPGGVKPWLSLMVMKESEGKIQPMQIGAIKNIDLESYNIIKLSGLEDGANVNVAVLDNKVFGPIMPDAADLPFLCHVRETKAEDGVKTEHAIVMSNRLPDAGKGLAPPEEHTAMLLSFDGRVDLQARRNKTTGKVALIVLHSWRFTPSRGGDFEQVVRSIAIRPNGGVLRFGNLPEPVGAGQSAPLSGGFKSLMNDDGTLNEPLAHKQDGLAIYKSPLLPFPPPARSRQFAIDAAPEEFTAMAPGATRDYSHAVAFELGHLLALANQDVLEDLRQVHGVIKPLDKDQVAVNKLPMALQKPDWVVNPADVLNHGWEWDKGAAGFEKTFKSPAEFVGATPGDVAGIEQQWQQWGAGVKQRIEQFATPVTGSIGLIDVVSVQAIELEKIFVDLEVKGKL